METGGETDESLVEQVREGKAAAFDLLDARYRRRLLRYIEPLVLSTSEAEDVVQEALISAFKAIHSFRGESTFSTWLFTIAINKAKNVRAQSFRRIPSDPHDSIRVEDEVYTRELMVETPETLLERDEVLRLVDAALDMLPREQREAFMLLELEGMTYDEIADFMHTPIGTVRSRVHRAREFVSTMLRNAE